MVQNCVGAAMLGTYTTLDAFIFKCSSIILALIFYDYILTLSEEMAFMWRSKSMVSILFVLNRYGSLFYGVVGFASGFPQLSEVGLVSQMLAAELN